MMRRPLDRERRRSSRPPPKGRFDDRPGGHEVPQTLSRREQRRLNNQFRKAARDGDIKEMKRLHGQGADINDPDRKGRTALMEAAARGDESTAGFLLARRASIKADDSNGETARSMALKNGHWGIVRMLELADGYNIYD